MHSCNQTIRCTVDQCKHHEKTENLCSLEAITVGTHEANPTVDQCTDCLSFERQITVPRVFHPNKELLSLDFKSI